MFPTVFSTNEKCYGPFRSKKTSQKTFLIPIIITYFDDILLMDKSNKSNMVYGQQIWRWHGSFPGHFSEKNIHWQNVLFSSHERWPRKIAWLSLSETNNND